ncbi:MAG: aldo/keto reductase [Puniceicoccaceae bacterium]|nr:MAG: aldo/keto reductase [Puniceicoccaceae bacterium]
MQYVPLGTTGFRASVAGLGCGGHSRLGLSRSGSEAEAEKIVQLALDLGINLIDTAAAYGTEPVVGRAIRGRPRESIVLCTKAGVREGDSRIGPDELRRRIEQSLRNLGTESIDLLYLHGVAAADYAHCVDHLLPEMLALKQKGLLRAIGVTEAFASDPGHEMLRQAVTDPHWDVVMVGFNLLNQSARERVLSQTRAQAIGTTCMFAVRRALSRPEALTELLVRLADGGHEALKSLDPAEPLGFLVGSSAAASLPDAAYRFCRYEPGIDVVLTGTGNPDHLRANVASILHPPLPAEHTARLRRLFAGVDSESGN